MHTIARYLVLMLITCVALLPGSAAPQQADAPIVVLTIDGAIGPAIGSYIQQAIEQAARDGASLVVLRLDTPGGLDTAMRDIIQSMLDASIPIVTYVWPQGARAASAGTYILYASHVAAMAPATNLGAATPVQLGAPATPAPAAEDDTAEAEPTGSSAMERKVLNDAVAYIRGLAERSGRNAQWAERAVREAASLSASQALAENVVDIVAIDVDDLLAQLHGRQVLLHGSTLTLETSGKPLMYLEVDWRTRLLSVLTNPSLILILGMIGIYGLIFEFYGPGFGLGGVVGVICLLMAGYGLQLLPLNYAGLGLLILGVALMIGEAFVPSFGILGIGGVIAFIMGGVMLVDTELDMFRISLPLLAAVAVFSALLLAFTSRMFLRIRNTRVVSGIETMIGQAGAALDNFVTEGAVQVQGEIWQARTDTPLQRGDAITVVAVNGLRLQVTKAANP